MDRRDLRKSGRSTYQAHVATTEATRGCQFTLRQTELVHRLIERSEFVVSSFVMPGIASATGLISARVNPIRRAKTKRVELSGSTKRAPFALRPFAGLFNPYPYGCSVLCNHPADCEAKEVVRRVKDSWATEGKALLLPEEMEMIRATLLAGGKAGTEASDNPAGTADAVPEELFRKYTDTDSRPLTPAPTLVSHPALTNRLAQESIQACHPREKTTLVLDLRGEPQNADETLTWHALTLEPPPTLKKSEVTACKITVRPQHLTRQLPDPIVTPEPNYDMSPNDKISGSDEPVIIRRRGKRLRKRKCRRDSTYGQQTEVRDPPEPSETQVSQVESGSRRESIQPISPDHSDEIPSPGKPSSPSNATEFSSSFISPEILQHLCRELDRDKVEAEFSIKRRIALEEALRVKGESSTSNTFQRPKSSMKHVPRIFFRQAARFEVLHSQSLLDLTTLDYLSKHVYILEGRKFMFSRAFKLYQDDSRLLPAERVFDALADVMGGSLTEEQRLRFNNLIGEISQALNFRSWCGICAAAERLLVPLQPRDLDPPTWLERTDFETLDRRLNSVQVNPLLKKLLEEIRDS
ncbi:uncharacterized protein [Prorops nasuta]|uniref:uncharacterized protein n=1 Tax=Prorops nasuta TaxID=863751 RepID=UPI0034CDEA93